LAGSAKEKWGKSWFYKNIKMLSSQGGIPPYPAIAAISTRSSEMVEENVKGPMAVRSWYDPARDSWSGGLGNAWGLSRPAYEETQP